MLTNSCSQQATFHMSQVMTQMRYQLPGGSSDLLCCLGLPLEDGKSGLMVSGCEGGSKGGVAVFVLKSEVNAWVGEEDVRALWLLAGDGDMKGTETSGILCCE